MEKQSRKPTQKVIVSRNGRFLTTQDGAPFFYLADTAWEMFHRLDRPQTDRYLADRAAKGYNVIQNALLAPFDGLNKPNAYGHRPFINNDPGNPAVVEGAENDYWDHCDYQIDKADESGIYMAVLPSWGDKVVHGSSGDGPVIFTTEAKAYDYGHFLGDRYKTRNNIIWVLGGDTDGGQNIWNAMAEGIADGTNGVCDFDGYADYSSAIMTYHPMGPSVSSNQYQSSPWLDFNMYQSGHVQFYLISHS